MPFELSRKMKISVITALFLTSVFTLIYSSHADPGNDGLGNFFGMVFSARLCIATGFFLLLQILFTFISEEASRKIAKILTISFLILGFGFATWLMI